MCSFWLISALLLKFLDTLPGIEDAVNKDSFKIATNAELKIH